MQGMKKGLSDYLPVRLSERLPAVIKRCLNRESAPGGSLLPCRQLPILEDVKDCKYMPEGEARHRTLLQHLGEGVGYVDWEERFTFANAAAERIFGVPPGSLAGRSLREFIDAQTWPYILEQTAKRRKGEESQYELEIVRPNGQKRILSVTATPGLIENGQPAGTIGVFRDVTAQRATEAALRNSEARFKGIFQSTSIGIAVFDRNGHAIETNAALQSMLGYSADELRSMAFLEYTHPDDRDRTREKAQGLYQGGRNYYELEKRCIRKDGRAIWVRLSVSLLKTVDDVPAFTVAMVQDITPQKQAEAALIEQQELLAQRVEERTAELQAANAKLEKMARYKDEFLASMSHELRTPLTAILGLSESLQEGVYGPLTERQSNSLATIRESGAHLLSLINDILDLSKIEAGKMALQLETVDIEALCQASLQLIRPAAQAKAIRLSSTVDVGADTVQADARRLKQILVNLLNNAVKFTPEGGTVGLEVAGDDTQHLLQFTVRDTGIGIAQEDLPRLFRPFEQLNGSLGRSCTGTGLGLALVRSLAALHGGRVEVSSEPGQGSRFTVSLPWSAAQTTAEARPIEPEENGPAGRMPGDECAAGGAEQGSGYPVQGNGSAGGPLLLLADDSPANSAAISDYLLAKGYRVLVAQNGQETLAQAATAHPDLILMDIQMPGMDGLEVISRLRNKEHAHTPVLALTALAMPGDRERCLAAGADGYMSKPISLPRLIEAVETHLQQRRKGHAP